MESVNSVWIPVPDIRIREHLSLLADGISYGESLEAGDDSFSVVQALWLLQTVILPCTQTQSEPS